MDNEKEIYGKVTAPDGEFDIVDYIITETKQGRQWTLSLLSDDTIALYIDSIDSNGEKLVQSMRLTKKTISILQLCLSQADKQFNLEMEKNAREMLESSDGILNIKIPNK